MNIGLFSEDKNFGTYCHQDVATQSQRGQGYERWRLLRNLRLIHEFRSLDDNAALVGRTVDALNEPARPATDAPICQPARLRLGIQIHIDRALRKVRDRPQGNDSEGDFQKGCRPQPSLSPRSAAGVDCSRFVGLPLLPTFLSFQRV